MQKNAKVMAAFAVLGSNKECAFMLHPFFFHLILAMKIWKFHEFSSFVTLVLKILGDRVDMTGNHSGPVP